MKCCTMKADHAAIYLMNTGTQFGTLIGKVRYARNGNKVSVIWASHYQAHKQSN